MLLHVDFFKTDPTNNPQHTPNVLPSQNASLPQIQDVAPLPTEQLPQNQQTPINSTNVETQQPGPRSQNDFIESFSQIESHSSKHLHHKETTSHEINQNPPPSSSRPKQNI